MIKERVQGKIVFVSSLLGYMSIVGYSSYAPAKHALRGNIFSNPMETPPEVFFSGLAETLRSELLLYSISVHIFFPGTIYSPGYIEENKIKPKITLQIEEGDTGATPEQSARTLLRGLPVTCHLLAGVHTAAQGSRVVISTSCLIPLATSSAPPREGQHPTTTFF